MYKPLPDSLTIKASKVNGLGLFAKETIPQATNLGMTHLQFGETLIRTPLGGFINHSDNPNCKKVKLKFTNSDKEYDYHFNKWNLITLKDIKQSLEPTEREKRRARMTKEGPIYI